MNHFFARYCRLAALMTFSIAVGLAATTHAQLMLSGGGLALVEEGPAAAAAGDPVPVNLATGATAFAQDVIAGGGFSGHQIAHLNDGAYGNDFSWIGDASPSFAGISFAESTSVQSVAFGRSNVLSGDPCDSGVCTDRHMDTYTLQYTTVANPDAATADSNWTLIGTLTYGASDGVGTNYNNTWQRHRYNFDPVGATGIRIGVANGGTAIDEIELYADAGDFVPPPPPPPPFDIGPAAGFDISWDGNDGVHFDAAAPPDGAQVPDNLALASNGATAFTSSDLGPQLGIAYHVAANLNDGFYGNANSWISADADPGPPGVAGIDLGGEFLIESIAFGRDNGNGAFDGSDPQGDCCGGQVNDRWQGIYTLQFTTAADPTTAGDADWSTIGTLGYAASEDTVPGDGFTGYFRHEYGVSQNGDAIAATGFRVLVPATGLGSGTDIDEIEIYGRAVPEPTGMVSLLMGLVMLGLRRRR